MKRQDNEITSLKLNMQMFVDEFMSRGYDPVFYKSQYDRMKLDNVMLYYGQSDLEAHIVYVCEESVFLNHPVNNQDICFLISSQEERQREDFKQPALFFHAVPIAVILNIANEILQTYHDFENSLYGALNTGGLNTLCNIAVRFFKNPMQIHDEKFILLSRPQYVSGMSEIVRDDVTGISSFSLSLINILKTSENYIKTLTTRGSHLWIEHSLTPYRVLYVNLFDDNDRYYGRVIINEINSIFYPSHFQLLEYFARFVLYAILKKPEEHKNSYMSFESFLQKFLRGEQPGREAALRAISQQNWQENDTYACVNVYVRENTGRINSMDIAQTSLLMRFGAGKVFQEKGSLWLVYDLTAGHMAEADFKRQLFEFARDGSYAVGISHFFHDFFRLTNACRQAEIALKYGVHQEDKVQIYYFDEAIIPYITGKILEGDSEEALCHEKLFVLMDYDMKKGTDYYKTLQTYIENERNLTNVANVLHIHRSTLQYRIEKIQELIDMPLDDPDVRFYLQCCFRILAL